MSNRNYKFETLQLHVGQEQADPATDSRAVPIYQTTSYVFHNSAHAAARFGLSDAGNIYGRLTNSTQDVLEKRIAALEGGVAALAVASGAAAISYTIQALAQKGDHIVSQKTIYGGSYNLLAHTLPQFGVSTTFVDIHNLEEVKAAIERSKPKKILILGTSDNMVGRIAKALDLPEISGFIHIEDIATKEEMEKARFHRLKEGKHIIPVPSVELKPHFSGYLVDPINSLLKRNQTQRRRMGGKSIVRPVFSYYGKLIIDDWALKAIVRKLLVDGENITKVADVKIEHVYKGDGEVGVESAGIVIGCEVVITYGKHIPTLVQKLQTQVRKDVEYMTGMVVKKRIILNGRGSRTRTCECWIQNPVPYQLGDSPI